MSLAWRFARRELRGGLKGFRVFLACLALGVAAIAAVGSLAAGVERSLADDARLLLGGDVEFSFSQRAATPEQFRALASGGSVSFVIEMRAMARTDTRRGLVELKAIDDFYPLIGAVQVLEGEANLARALGQRDGVWGIAAERSTLARLGLALGDRVQIGDLAVELRAVLGAEPDRTANPITLAPRVMIAAAAVPATGLVQPGTLARWQYRVALPPGADVRAFIERMRTLFPNAGWRIRGLDEAAPGVQRWVERIALFLTLVGLTTLLVGGVGVANSVRNYLDGRRTTIATLKCLGAGGGLILRVYLAQILTLALLGVAIGVALGAAIPWLLGPLAAAQIGVAARVGFYPQPLILAAAFGLLVAFGFALWPVARARDIPPAALFRDLVAPQRRWPRPAYIVITVIAFAALVGLIVVTAIDRPLALGFVGAAIGTFLTFRAAAWGLQALARRAPRARWTGLRLALANMHRPGSPMPGIVLSLGLGLTVLVAIAQVQGNLARDLEETLPRIAPSFFFIDIQPDQVATFDRILRESPAVTRTQRVPSLRGRITQINRVPIERARVASGAQWAIGSDRGLTYTGAQPAEARIVAGEWWPADYAGPPLISLEAGIARGFGVGVGDTLTINLLGAEIEARIANLRAVDWTSLGINFAIVFAPGTLEAAPQTFIATATVTPEGEDEIERRVTEAMPNVSTIRVRTALATVEGVLTSIADAGRLTAAVTLIAGTLVLAGALAASQRRRIYDSVILKVLGARRRMIIGAFLIEFGLIGLATAIVAAVIGTLCAWGAMAMYMRIGFTVLPETVFATALFAVLLVIGFGLAGTWRALGAKAAPVLRNT